MVIPVVAERGKPGPKPKVPGLGVKSQELPVVEGESILSREDVAELMNKTAPNWQERAKAMEESIEASVNPRYITETRTIYAVRDYDGTISVHIDDRAGAELYFQSTKDRYRLNGGTDPDVIKLVSRQMVVVQYLDDWHEVE